MAASHSVKLKYLVNCSTYLKNYCTSSKVVDEAIDRLKSKIIYNSLLIKSDETALSNHERRKLSFLKRRQLFLNDGVSPKNRSISLKYLSRSVENTFPAKNEKPASFPFAHQSSVIKSTVTSESPVDDVGVWLDSPKKFIKSMVRKKNYIPHDVNIQRDGLEVEEDFSINKYGTADPSVPVSDTPCGGCGAFLHCQDTSIPGFIPKELFDGLNFKELQTLICQRCHFLKEYDIALGVDVTAEEYPKILSQIRYKKALVLLMVDLTDYPCSIWPGLSEIIGKDRPLVVVGNKVDLLIEDSSDCLLNINESLITVLEKCGVQRRNIKHVALISAKTGYGVEELITAIHTNWRYQGDVYIVGCTNVGKSSLFNALIQSDFCKVQAVDLMQRATVSEWPGTTLNLLRFPILRPSTWRLQIRHERMLTFKKREFRKMMRRLEIMKNSRYEKQVPLAAPIGRSFVPENVTASDPFSLVISSSPSGVRPLGVDPDKEDFANSKWCFDTPGVVQPDQLIHLLTTEEIMQVIPKKLILPRILHLRPGFTVFIATLSRFDLLDGPDLVWLSLFASEELPLTIVKTQDAEEVYESLLGTDLAKIPSGNAERLKKWPNLRSKDFEIVGKVEEQVSADVVLSSSGWIAVTLRPAEFCKVRVWTPEARGIHLRDPPLMRFAHRFRGSRIKGRPIFNSCITIVDKDLQQQPSMENDHADSNYDELVKSDNV